jgi:hypothetical protein
MYVILSMHLCVCLCMCECYVCMITHMHTCIHHNLLQAGQLLFTNHAHIHKYIHTPKLCCWQVASLQTMTSGQICYWIGAASMQRDSDSNRHKYGQKHEWSNFVFDLGDFDPKRLRLESNRSVFIREAAWAPRTDFVYCLEHKILLFCCFNEWCACFGGMCVYVFVYVCTCVLHVLLPCDDMLNKYIIKLRSNYGCSVQVSNLAHHI